ncbi:MAG: choice-of-anchor tandem repeat GloVer-containing protein [Candidatus Korobacteraceae bacterium]
MTRSEHNQHPAFALLAGVASLLVLLAMAVQAQTYSVIHNFTGGADGAGPGGLIIDAAGNLYGAAAGGGLSSQNCDDTCGVVFKMKSSGQGWVLTPLYQFQGGSDGSSPAGVVFGQDGTLYGITTLGGMPCPSETQRGCGTIFNLRPQPAACKSALCPWTESVLYRFAGGSTDGAIPVGQPIFDHAGNLYGATYEGGVYTANCASGNDWCGTIFELTPSNGGWSENLPYIFTGGDDGSNPEAGVTLDAAGNLYGTAEVNGAGGGGTVFELTPSGSGWIENTLHSFTGNGSSGYFPAAGLIFDPAGNLYGTTQYGGGADGTVFELSPAGSGWTFNQVYSFAGPLDLHGPLAPVLRDSAGNLYGTTFEVGGGANVGEVFELSPSNGGWTYTVLHYFTDDHGDGGLPTSNLAMDAHGNLYGTTTTGGTDQLGTVWEITR